MNRSNYIEGGETLKILGVSKSRLDTLVKQGRIRCKLIDRRGGVTRRLFSREDAIGVRGRGERLTRRVRPRAQIALYRRYFGDVPKGFKVVLKDGNAKNLSADNLDLVPRYTNSYNQRAPNGRINWTKAMKDQLRAQWQATCARDLAKQFGTSTAAIKAQAARMGLRKTYASTAAILRTCRQALPLGTERPHHTGNILVKVSNEGGYRRQWRFKHHLTWEAANGMQLPAGYRVAFRDGNRLNLDPSNLVALTRNEASALANIGFRSCSKELQEVIRLTTRVRREVGRRLLGGSRKKSARASSRVNKGGARRRERRIPWTPEQDAILRREHPVTPLSDIAAMLGRSFLAVRKRAQVLGLGTQNPETIMAEARAKAAAKAAQQAAA